MSAIIKIIDSFRGQSTLGKANNELGDKALEEYNQMLQTINDQDKLIQKQYDRLIYIQEALSTLKNYAV